ncbi:MAG: hypothetical protein O7C62_08440, partial [Rickettsia endosymbiont of Ixodes persulcatus]|nr:hypothetical protein [Rickettsia endosymbiont of Ixodes persulcatus]
PYNNNFSYELKKLPKNHHVRTTGTWSEKTLKRPKVEESTKKPSQATSQTQLIILFSKQNNFLFPIFSANFASTFVHTYDTP